jgi:hypothetical protein
MAFGLHPQGGRRKIMRRSTSSGILALLGIGVYVAIRNRQLIGEFLDRQGVKLPDAERLVSQFRTRARDVVSQFTEKKPVSEVVKETLQKVS